MAVIRIGLVAFVLLAIAPASAAVLKGSVRVPGSTAGAPPARYVTRGSAQAVLRDADTQDRVAVIVDRLDAPIQSAPVDPDTALIMAQEGTAFVPNLLVVPVGGVVSFPNHDPLFHNVFSYSSTRTFDLGRYPRGQSRDVAFDKPGIVRVFCEIHASMYAAIVVAGSPWYRLLQPEEPFQFNDLPAGHYKILAVDPTGRFTDYDVTLTESDIKEVHLKLGS